MTNSNRRLLPAALIVLSLLLLPFSKVHADEYDDFWMWLDHIKDDLKNAPSWNENKFRAQGYWYAVSGQLQKLHPSIDGGVELNEDQSYNLNLSSGIGTPYTPTVDSFPVIEEIAKRSERYENWNVVTSLKPQEYQDFEISLYHPDNGKYQSEDIRLLIDNSKAQKDITVFLPNLENIKDANNRNSYFNAFRTKLIRHIGEILFATEIGNLSYKPLSQAHGDLIPLNQLLKTIDGEDASL